MGSLQVTRRQVLPGLFLIIMGAQDAMPIGCTAIKPVERHGLEAVKWFLYDKDTGAIIGRTPKSWALITIFYIIYYSCLAAFWVLCLYIFFQFIECRAWAKNIKYNRRDRVGIVRFELIAHDE